MTMTEFEKDRDQFTFGVDDVLKAARKIVSGKEEFVYDRYNGCSYADRGAPSCLVGHVIAALDPKAFQRLEAVEAGRGTEAAQNLTDRGIYLDEDFWTPEAAEVLAVAQDEQDRGARWGRALDRAEAKAQDLRGH